MTSESASFVRSKTKPSGRLWGIEACTSARHIPQGARLPRLLGLDGERLLNRSVEILVIQ